MNQTEITAAIRKGIREPKPITLTDTEIVAVTLRGVAVLGLEIKQVDSSFFRKRAILSSDNGVSFDCPSDCLTVEGVWDLMTTADDVEDASNETPIVITATAHGLDDDTKILMTSVGGNTAANAIWKIDNGDDDTFELSGSVGNAAYTSGGKFVTLSSSWRQIKRKNMLHMSWQDRYFWYPENEKIIVDYHGFSNDILAVYMSSPSAITDIPKEYHEGLVAFGIINCMTVPSTQDASYADKARQVEYAKNMYSLTVDQIRRSLAISSEPKELYDAMHWDIT